MHGLVSPRVRFFKSCKDRSEFFLNFDDFDAKMNKSRFLCHGWSEYKETLLPQSKNSNVIESTIRPSDFINLTELEHAGLKLKWFHNIPGTFVGFGLLFTFIGLVAALFFASQAIQAVGGEGIDATQQTVKMQGALAQLLSAATFKFWTSIAGLGSSIVLGMVYRFSVRWLDKRLNALCREIERCTRTVTTEMLANRQLNELREQSTQLKEFTGQLAFNLGKALEEALRNAMPGVMHEAMLPVSEKLDSVTQNISNMNESAIQTMTQEFGSVVSANAGSEIRGASEALISVKDALLETSKAVAGSGSGLSGQIAEAAGDLRAAAKAITEGMSGITASVRNDVDKTRDTLDAQLRAATDGLTQVAEIIRGSLADAGGVMRNSTHEAGTLFAQQIADAVARVETGTQANANAIQEALGQLRDVTMNATGAMTTRTQTVVQTMRETSEQMAQSVAAITGQIRQGAVDGVAGLTERLVKAAEAMQEASHRNSDHIGEAVERIIAAGSQAETGVGQAAAKVVSSTDQVLTRFQESIGKVRATMDAVEGKIGLHAQALDGVNRAARETEGSLSTAARALVDAGQPLKQATQTLREAIDNSTRSIETTVKALDETHRQSTTLSKELSGTLQELQTIWNRHANRFDKADENLGNALIKIKDISDKNTTILEEQVQKIDGALAQTVNIFAGNIEELNEIATELTEATKSLKEATTASRQRPGLR
ncbi:MAG: anti-phage defense protein ZorA [Magnetococcales bacterium]|nr:anti-phage defense protein ZorA [Magnetococcales bacterium]